MKVLIALVASVLLSLPALAQDPPPEPYRPLFSTFFAKPTGQNGFEEIVLAGDLARTSKFLDIIREPMATLTQKRLALADPDIKRALALLRAGLAKAKRFPGSAADGPPSELFSPLRELGRLLKMEQYVLLADGKVGSAIDSLRDGLTLAHTVASEMIIGNLVAIAINALTIREVANHLDQFSARDCERLTKLASDWLSTPDPGIAALEAERKYVLQGSYASLGGDSRISPEVRAIMSAQITAVQNMLRLDPWKRGKIPPVEGNGAAAEYVRHLDLEKTYEQVLESFAKDLAKVQLLGVHAAIRRFRWEYNRLPGSLTELKLGRLALDPFTGQPFIFIKSGDSDYILKSVKVDRL